LTYSIHRKNVQATIVTHKFKKGPVEVSITVTATYHVDNKKEQVIIREARFLRIEASGAYWPQKPFSESVTVILNKNDQQNPLEVLVNNKQVPVPFLD